jgi:hypothetical protein
MKAAIQNKLYTAERLSSSDKKTLALEAMSQRQTITDLSKENDVSRKFIYAQKEKAVAAVNDAFDEAKDEEKILFHLPVTKSWINQVILSLALDCRGCFRGIMRSLKSLLDFDISIGSISHVVKSKIENAMTINQKHDLSAVKLATIDELFHQNKPVLAGVDITSLYCFLLTKASSRDGDTWGIHLLDLKKQGLQPERFIADDGSGLHAGLAIAFPEVPCDMDHFHISKRLTELRRYLRNRLKTAKTYLDDMYGKMEKAKACGNPHQYSRKLGLAKKHYAKMYGLSKESDILISWMEHDVLNKAGPNRQTREMLYEFIVEEFERLQVIHPHRIKEVVTYLKNQQPHVFGFVDVLQTKFEGIAKRFGCSVDIIWKICQLQRCDQSGMNYAVRVVSFYDLFGEKFDAIEDAVITAMNTTERTSSMVENLNSRIRPYFELRQEIGYGYLELLRFYLNHVEFMRSDKPHRAKKTPTQLLTGKEHAHWLELLGFKCFKRAA